MIVTVYADERYPEYELKRGGSDVPGLTKIVERSGGWGTRVCIEMSEQEFEDYQLAKKVFDDCHRLIKSRMKNLPTLPEIHR